MFNIIRLIVLSITFIFVTIPTIKAQEFDPAELPIYDVYSSPDLAKGETYVVGNDWTSLNYVSDPHDAKIAKAKERVPGYLEYTSNNVDCDINTKIFLFNFTGLKNYVNYEGKDEDDDGIKEGYDYYKNKIKFGWGAENIPFYEASVTTQGGIHHSIPSFFSGPKNLVEKPNVLDIKQWTFIDDITGEEIKIGSPLINENSPVEIRAISWREDLGIFYEQGLIKFYLNDGVGSYKEEEVNKYLMIGNPHQTYINLGSIEDKFYTKEENVSFEEPLVETNSEHYSPKLERILSDTIVYGPNHYSFKVTDIGKLKMGRWNGNKGNDYFLSALADSSSYRIEVDLGTGVEDDEAKDGFDMDQNFPNPFQSETTIPYAVTTPGEVTFELWGQKGQKLKTMKDYAGYYGEHEFKLNMNGFAPGVYLLRAIDHNGNARSIKLRMQ